MIVQAEKKRAAVQKDQRSLNQIQKEKQRLQKKIMASHSAAFMTQGHHVNHDLLKPIMEKNEEGTYRSRDFSRSKMHNTSRQATDIY